MRALILRMQTSTASFIIPQDVVTCRIACRRSARMRTSAARIRTQGGTRYCKSAARGAGIQFSRMQLFRPGQNRSGKSTGDREARARLGALGGAGRGALILPGGAGRGALVSAPAPLPTLDLPACPTYLHTYVHTYITARYVPAYPPTDQPSDRPTGRSVLPAAGTDPRLPPVSRPSWPGLS